jgi:hypothetical protein
MEIKSDCFGILFFRLLGIFDILTQKYKKPKILKHKNTKTPKHFFIFAP